MSVNSGRWVHQSLLARTLSAMVLAPIAVWSVWIGGAYFAVVLGLTLLLALHEFFRLATRAGIPVPSIPGIILAGVLITLSSLHATHYSGLALMSASLWIVGRSLRAPLEGRFQGLALTVFGVAYVIGLGVHLIWLRELPEGGRVVLLVLLSTWAADVGAFFTGISWGKHALAPFISPKKSVEGVVGGLVLTVLTTWLLSRVLIPELLAPWAGILLGCLLGLIAPVGDLVESLIKRSLGAKDTSRAIPGHGGVLDRIDSLLFTAPIAYYAIQLLTRTL